ncbi:hypothetical protein SAMN06297387_10125 [Streptomyces zhaozhouensis]|uniref:Uncharacterized protein n=1 Tax=Streptomyces zhaozhouensis TaxID=1300267 RepID=A0A286DHR1_9ACTN|nr:hypothetical protein SAMN06297387_10125 [Streptomyces zhaozhouensis]
MAPMSTVAKSCTGTVANEERRLPSDLAFSSSEPVAWSCRSRSPVEVPR